ncbi:MAG: hypothetical protein COS76_01525 [Candidatus Portnoybacteria bacterium CG06_land_8_20_14_3_00_39_12]|uniref:DUF5671 domain-containing protein n=2 Tax=Candidatus Portnoyibacteriota TaxID=1817913 RepID=A0A2M7UGQ7_9BACT|nr:MAG: hypothetical protein COS76_01525 [Candidatus Portnoybacteria bacterium CG06_land_8_20_14_3_00_39_12]PIZ70402.1 MAG: hypothetical protein COY09_03050 [Candidatus Portnoybacteria bacterium CG_4_10_14_0_2_um_filter_39_11]
MSEKKQTIRVVFIVAWIWIVGLAGSFPACGWFFRMFFPVIEFNFGPEYTKIEKTKRKRLYGFMSLILIPFVLTIFYDYIKNLLK